VICFHNLIEAGFTESKIIIRVKDCRHRCKSVEERRVLAGLVYDRAAEVTIKKTITGLSGHTVSPFSLPRPLAALPAKPVEGVRY